MSLSKQQLTDLLSGAPIGGIKSIKQIPGGHASLAYKVASSQGNFMALVRNSRGIGSGDVYTHQYAILKALEAADYGFSPRPVYLSSDHNLLLMSFEPGKNIGWLNTTGEDTQETAVKTLVTALLDLQDIPNEHYQKVYKRICGKELQPATAQKNIQTYIVDWFEQALNAHPNKELIEWMRPKVEACKKFAEQSKPSDVLIFTHGDTSEGNILVTDDLKLKLIDWESSGFYQYPEGWQDYCMAYIMNHVQLAQKHKSFAISLVCERLDISKNALEKAIARCQELVKFGDIQWAIMMNSRSAAGQIDGDSNEYLTIAQQRIAEYERDFASRSFLQDTDA